MHQFQRLLAIFHHPRILCLPHFFQNLSHFAAGAHARGDQVGAGDKVGAFELGFYGFEIFVDGVFGPLDVIGSVFLRGVGAEDAQDVGHAVDDDGDDVLPEFSEPAHAGRRLDVGSGEVEDVHVLGDQRVEELPVRLRDPEAVGDVDDDVAAGSLVAVKDGSAGFLVDGAFGGFAHVVEHGAEFNQGCSVGSVQDGLDLLRGGAEIVREVVDDALAVVENGQGMAPDVQVVPGVLGAAFHGEDLREDDFENAEVVHRAHGRGRARGVEDLREFGHDSFGCGDFKLFRVGSDGGEGGFLNVEIEFGGEAESPKYPKGVVGEDVGAGDSYHFLFEVPGAVHEIDDVAWRPAPIHGNGHGVDGEVPPVEVGRQVAAEHRGDVEKIIGVVPIHDPVARLVRLFEERYEGRVVGIGQFSGRGFGVPADEVDVLWLLGKEKIPDGSAHHVQGGRGFLQGLQPGGENF